MRCPIAFKIVASPGDWTGPRVVDELGCTCTTRAIAGATRSSHRGFGMSWCCVTSTPTLQMERFLGWWENAARGTSGLSPMPSGQSGENDAQLLEEAAEVLAPSRLDAGMGCGRCRTPGRRRPRDVQVDYALVPPRVPAEAVGSRFDDHRSYFTMVFDHTHDLVADEARDNAFAYMAQDMSDLATRFSTVAALLKLSGTACSISASSTAGWRPRFSVCGSPGTSAAPRALAIRGSRARGWRRQRRCRCAAFRCGL